LTGAPICQLNRIAALRASRRCTTRVHSPAGTRPLGRSRPSWCFNVQMIYVDNVLVLTPTRLLALLGSLPAHMDQVGVGLLAEHTRHHLHPAT
jgi:hypothetical protein